MSPACGLREHVRPPLVTSPSAEGTLARLVLPSLAADLTAAMPSRCGRCPQPVAGDLALLASPSPSAALRAPGDPDDRARYRWIVGHQAVFAIWQMQTRWLHAVTDDPVTHPGYVAAIADAYRIYALLLLYTGSCSPARYAATVRADMHAYHRAFSGQWARDYAVILASFRRLLRTHPASVTAPIASALRTANRIHLAIARKLVPGGVSLLQQAGRRHAAVTAAEHDLYDSFFLVSRETVCHACFAAQAVRRFAQVAVDIAANGLADDDGPPLAGPGEQALADRLGKQAGGLLLRLARAVLRDLPTTKELAAR